MINARFPQNQFQKRPIRVRYGQTLANPFATQLDPSLLGTGSGDPDTFTDVYNIPSNLFTLQGGLIPGTCMMRSANGLGAVTVASGVALGGSVPQQVFGLLNNFVGGNFDELWGNPYVAVWQGVDSVYELIAPAFNPQGLSAAFAAAPAGSPVFLYAGLDGRLCCDGAASPFGGSAGNRQVVAHLLDYPTNGYIVIQLKV